MSFRYLEYPLVDGYVHHWLAAGPQPQSDGVSEGTSLPFKDQPVDRAKLDDNLAWRYVRCQGDHLLDLSTFQPVPVSLGAWASVRLKVAQPGTATLALTSYGPARLWVNGEPVMNVDGERGEGPLPVARVEVALNDVNDVVVYLSQSGVRAVPMGLSLAVEGVAGEVTVQLATPARFPNRQKGFEELFEQAYLEEAASYKGRVINLRFAEGTSKDLRYWYSVQDMQGMIYVEGTWDVDTDKATDVGHPQRIFERPMQVVLRAPGKEFFEQELRYQRGLPLYVVDNQYSEDVYGTYAERRQEGLEDAARRDDSLFSEIAKMALEQWKSVSTNRINAAIAPVAQRAAGSELLLVALLGMVARYGQQEGFPQSVVEPLAQAAANFAYTPTAESGVDYDSESSQLLLLTAGILAGQQWPDKLGEVKTASETQAHHWLRLRGQNGYVEWDSPVLYEQIVVALTHLVSLAENETVRDLAAVLLDKTLFDLAMHTFKGVFGGSMGKASAAYHSAALKSGRAQAIAGVSRLLWGMGIYTANTAAGVVSLATADYEFPSFFGEMALAPHIEGEIWSRERSKTSQGEANRALYKTANFMLGSAQDYCPGTQGAEVHAWQATLGPDALVFVNHPVAFAQDETRTPGFWLGNGALPRVAQFKDALIAVYNNPDAAGLDFTHAYFPTLQFDEYYIYDGWAFGRKGLAYVALTCANGFELVKRAPDAYRELRSPGRQNVWLCQMGRLETDGTFAQFRQQVLKLDAQYNNGANGMDVTFTTVRGDQLRFGWQGAFTRNGKEQPLSGFALVDNPYCQADLPAKEMDITYDETVMRLSFE